jgi:putative transposase
VPLQLIKFVVSTTNKINTKGGSTMKKVAEEKEKNNQAQEIIQREGIMAIEELLTANQAQFIQQTLEVEAEEFLGRKRYEHTESAKGYRNGSYAKRVRLSGGSVTIQKSHFRNTKEKFASRILKGIADLAEKVRSMALEMYVRGLSTRDIEATLREPDGKPMFSRTMISTLTQRLYEQPSPNRLYRTWQIAKPL